jgi:hypothetical protein
MIGVSGLLEMDTLISNINGCCRTQLVASMDVHPARINADLPMAMSVLMPWFQSLLTNWLKLFLILTLMVI